MRPVNEMSIAEHLPGELMTLEEWAAMPEDDEGELVDGVLAEEEMPDLTHETAVAWLLYTLRSWLIPRRGLVRIPSDVAIEVVSPRRGIAGAIAARRRATTRRSACAGTGSSIPSGEASTSWRSTTGGTSRSSRHRLA